MYKNKYRHSIAFDETYQDMFLELKKKLIVANPKIHISDSDVIQYLLDTNFIYENSLFKVR